MTDTHDMEHTHETKKQNKKTKQNKKNRREVVKSAVHLSTASLWRTAGGQGRRVYILSRKKCKWPQKREAASEDWWSRKYPQWGRGGGRHITGGGVQGGNKDSITRLSVIKISINISINNLYPAITLEYLQTFRWVFRVCTLHLPHAHKI